MKERIEKRTKKKQRKTGQDMEGYKRDSWIATILGAEDIGKNILKLKRQSIVTSTQFYVYIISLSLSPPELCGYRCREESFLPVGRPLRPEQPAGSPVQSHPLEKDGEFTICILTTVVEDEPLSTITIMEKYSITSECPALKILL